MGYGEAAEVAVPRALGNILGIVKDALGMLDPLGSRYRAFAGSTTVLPAFEARA